jgi:hypothetical protein
MYCPTCHTVVAASDELTSETHCPVCGASLLQPVRTADAVVTFEDAVVRVEGAPEQHWICGYRPEYDPKPPMAVILRRRKQEAVAVCERVAALPALAWRQPAVQAAVKTGAGAIALSLAAHAARRWLEGSHRGRAGGEGLLPALADALGSPDHGPRLRREREPDEGALVVETFIYARRVIRR